MASARTVPNASAGSPAAARKRRRFMATPRSRLLCGCAYAGSLPQHRLLVERFPVAAHQRLHRLACRGGIGMHEQEHLRPLVTDRTVSAFPLTLGLPDGEPLRKARRDLVAQEHLPL